MSPWKSDLGKDESMGLKDRLNRLEGEIPEPECETCHNNPLVVLHGETVSEVCPDCGKKRTLIVATSEEGRQLALRLIAGERAS